MSHWPEFERVIIPNAGKDFRAVSTLPPRACECRWYHHFGRQLAIINKVGRAYTCVSVNPVLGTYLQKLLPFYKEGIVHSNIMLDQNKTT